MSETDVLTPEPSADEAGSHVTDAGNRSRLLWTLALIAVVAIVGIGLWFVLAGDDVPKVTFDGETATYSGPTSFEAGTVTFTFDATDYDTEVAFVAVHIVSDDAMTMADFEAYAAENSARSAPPWAGVYHINYVTPDEAVNKELRLTEGTWLVVVSTAPNDSDTVFPAALIEVTG
ncbi:MAG: hypothetical protein OES13_10340 [Acidimicrobiia bacterium]|nr:hypothetical protein [Acidimicrobiia bacterium]